MSSVRLECGSKAELEKTHLRHEERLPFQVGEIAVGLSDNELHEYQAFSTENALTNQTLDPSLP